MKRLLRVWAVCLIAALALGGCFKEKRDVTLNPDGSGKVIYEARLPLMQEIVPPGQERDLKKDARKEVAKILSDSEGVTAWKDVTYEVDKDGVLVFRGTAYFSDLNKLNIHGSTRMNTRASWQTEGGMGRLELEEEEKGKKEPAKLTAAEVEERAFAARNQFKQQLPMVTAMLAEFRIEWTFALPGAPDKTINFEKVPGQPNRVRVLYDGPKIVETLNKLADDDAFWKAQAASGADPEDGPKGELLNEKLFGTRGALQTAVRPPLKEQFDYASEVAAGRAGFPAMKAALKLDEAPAVAPPSEGGAFKQLRVAGVCLVSESDDEKGIQPFNRQKGFWIALAGELPGSVLAVKEGVLKTAMTDNGEDLLPTSEWARKVNWPRLEKDQTTVTFECQTRAPGPKVRGFKEISGTLTYTSAKGTKDVDLGTLALKAGTKATELNARIESVAKSASQQTTSELALYLRADYDTIKGVRFLDAKGNEIEAKLQGTFSSNDTCTLTFVRPGEFPPEAKVIVQLYDNFKEYVIPFKVEDIDLLGRPMGSHAGHDAPAAKPAEKAADKPLYHCPMHPNYVTDKPGTCPICNMDLVPMLPAGHVESGGTESDIVEKALEVSYEMEGIETLVKRLAEGGLIEPFPLPTPGKKYGWYSAGLPIRKSIEGHQVLIQESLIFRPDRSDRTLYYELTIKKVDDGPWQLVSGVEVKGGVRTPVKLLQESKR